MIKSSFASLIIVLLLYALSWLIINFLVFSIMLCFDMNFTLKIGTGVSIQPTLVAYIDLPKVDYE